MTLSDGTEVTRELRAEEDPSLLSYLDVLIRYRVSILALALVLAAVAGTLSLLQPRTYTSTASFAPQTSRGRSGLGGIAAQLGVPIGQTEPTQSPDFYVDLVYSREILEDVARLKAPSGGTVMDALGVEGSSVAERLPAAVETLRAHIDAMSTVKTGVVRLKVTMESPKLAHAINVRLLELLNRFDVERRQSQARAEREFVERRLDETKAQLREAEEERLHFMEQNRVIVAPSLQLKLERLNRHVTIIEQVFASLSEALETAKIDQVRDTPVLTIIERPDLPVVPNGRGTVRRAVFAFLLGLMLGALWAFAREAVASQRRQRPARGFTDGNGDARSRFES